MWFVLSFEQQTGLDFSLVSKSVWVHEVCAASRWWGWGRVQDIAEITCNFFSQAEIDKIHF